MEKVRISEALFQLFCISHDHGSAWYNNRNVKGRIGDSNHKGYGKFRLKRFSALLLTAALGISSLNGCGVSTEEGEELSGNTADMSGNDDGKQADFSEDGVAMGRYVEKTEELKEALSGYRNKIFLLADGRLVITDPEKPMLVSEDGGITWTELPCKPFEELVCGEAWVRDCAVGKDGMAAVLYEKYEKTDAADEDGAGEQTDTADHDETAGDDAAESAAAGGNADSPEEEDTAALPEGNDVQTAAAAAIAGQDYEEQDRMMIGLRLIYPDGRTVEADISAAGEDGGAQHVWIDGSGRIFVGTDGVTLFEVEPEGTCREFLTFDGAPQLIQFQENLLIADGYEYDTIVIYDMENKTYIEDDALADFIEENYGDRSFNGGSWYDLYFFPGEDGVLYLAGRNGLYRHVIGGTVMEQVVDGSLCGMGSPAYRLCGMTVSAENEFLAVYGDAKVVRYVYDAAVPSVPTETIRAYSLQDNSTLRQAIFLYQSANPEVYVEYETGMTDDLSVTGEDAIKKLNTRIMAGEGPDLIILDGLPADSYVEKGMLENLEPLIARTGMRETLFSNIVDAFDTGEGIFYLPTEASIPVIAGRKRDVDGMDSLTGIADGIEKIRRENPEKDILRICSPKGIMKQFAFVCAPAWQAADKTIERGALTEFFTQTKRIYDAQMDGLPEEKIRQYEERQDESMEYYGETEEDRKYFGYGVNELLYIMGYTQLIAGSVGYPYAYAELTSVQKEKGHEEDAFRRMDGQSSRVFVAETLAGISAASENKERAGELLQVLLGADDIGGSGFPVNRAAFEDWLFPEDFVSENTAYSGIGMTDEEGHIYDFTIYWYGSKHADTLREWMSGADTPYVRNEMLEEAVYDAGTRYMRGDMELEEAVEQVEKRMAIYLAE